jgi:hypothetical protein
MKATFEERTGAFAPEDPWFEERSRAFWCDAITRGRFGREMEAQIPAEDRRWLGPLERAHRGLWRRVAPHGPAREGTEGTLLVDVWSGAEIAVTTLDEASRAELDAGAEQLFDARVVGSDDPLVLALLPGAVFHPLGAGEAIAGVLEAARARALSTDETLDALLRMERSLRALSRVKPGYAYRAEALVAQPAAGPRAVRRPARGST